MDDEMELSQLGLLELEDTSMCFEAAKLFGATPGKVIDYLLATWTVGECAVFELVNEEREGNGVAPPANKNTEAPGKQQWIVVEHQWAVGLVISHKSAAKGDEQEGLMWDSEGRWKESHNIIQLSKVFLAMILGCTHGVHRQSMLHDWSCVDIVMLSVNGLD